MTGEEYGEFQKKERVRVSVSPKKKTGERGLFYSHKQFYDYLREHGREPFKHSEEPLKTDGAWKSQCVLASERDYLLAHRAFDDYGEFTNKSLMEELRVIGE